MATGYFIGFIDVTDPDKYKNYTALTPDIVAKHGGAFVVRGGPYQVVEGGEENRRVVVIRFPSLDQAWAFWNSPEYAEAKKEREGAARMQALIVEGAA